MSTRALWLPDVLRDARLPIAIEPGWEKRGRPFPGDIGAVVCHHTAGREGCNACSLGTVRDGREGLRNLLSQLLLAQDGVFVVVGSGVAWHAGKSELHGRTNLNSWTIGIEAENSGKPSDPIVGVQYEHYVRGVAAILRFLKRGPEWAAAHKEVARPRGRKPDPTFDMVTFRADVDHDLRGVANRPPVVPHTHTEPGRCVEAHPVIRNGARGRPVNHLQHLINLRRRAARLPDLATDGTFGDRTETAVKVMQKNTGLGQDGVVGPRTWAKLHETTDRLRI